MWTAFRGPEFYSKRLRCTYPGGRAIDYSFDEIDRPLVVSDGAGDIATYSWIGPGVRRLRVQFGNETRLSFVEEIEETLEDIGYDAVQRVQRMRYLLPDGETAFIDREYEYNRANMRTLERRNDDSSLEDQYSYDSLYRVVRSQYDQEGEGGADRRDVKMVMNTCDLRRNTQGVAYSVEWRRPYSASDTVHSGDGMPMVRTVTS